MNKELEGMIKRRKEEITELEKNGMMKRSYIHKISIMVYDFITKGE